MSERDLDRLAAHLAKFLAGSVAEKRHLLKVDPQMLADAAARAGDLKVDAQAVSRVLGDFQSGQVIASEAQAWASFVRSGCFPEPQASTPPLAIRYDGAGAEAAAQIIARFDELGELPDEPIGDAELAGMIATMREAAKPAS